MNAQVRPTASARRFVIPAVALLAVLAVLAAAVLLYSATRVVSVSGRSESFVLKPGQIRMGILRIERGASASFQEGSYWIGPVVAEEGSLTVGRGATITGPVILFNNSLQLPPNASVHGSVVLFNGVLTLDRQASVHGSVVLFNGGLALDDQASVHGSVVLFNGGLALDDQASVGGSAVLFGPLRLGSEAAVYGKVLTFAGGLDLGPGAVLRDGAVAFGGDVHLSPGAQVRHDLVLAEGNATLDNSSTIAGVLYLSPEATSQRGRLIAADQSLITGGVVRPDDIESIATRNIGRWLLLRLLRLAALPLIGLGLLIGLVVFLVWRATSRKLRPGTGARLPEMNLQPTAPGAG